LIEGGEGSHNVVVAQDPVLRELRHYYREADISVLIRTSTLTSL
jgi:hypothetical protein